MGTIVSNPKKPPPFRCFLNIIINYIIMVPLSSRSALLFFSTSHVLHSTLKTSLYTSNYFYMHYITLPPSTSHHVCTYSLIFPRCCAKPDKSTNKHHTHTDTHTHTRAHTHTHIHTYLYLLYVSMCLCMDVCMYICMDACVYLSIYLSTYVLRNQYINIYTYTFIQQHAHPYIHIHSYTSMHTHIYIYIHIHMYMYTYMHMHMHMHMYMYMYMYMGAKPYVWWHTFSTFPISHHVFELTHHVALLCSRNWQRGMGWGGLGWGGDVNVRLKLNTPLMLRWAWGDPDQYIRSWQWRWENALCPDLLKKQHRSTCTMITETGKAKKGPDFVWKGCQTQEQWLFFLKDFTLRRLRNTERVVIFWQWWCAYMRDSAPGGMYIHMVPAVPAASRRPRWAIASAPPPAATSAPPSRSAWALV